MSQVGGLRTALLEQIRRRSGPRGPASLLAETTDGIVPSTDQIKPSMRDDEAKRIRSYRRTALIVACALFMQNLDSTVLATALPTMAREFAVPATGMSLALTSYLLALAVFIPASGHAADRFGTRLVFQAAIMLFTVGSTACGLAPGLEFLILARFVQGIGGAMMVPVGRLVLLRTVDRRDLVSAMSWLAMPALIGPILGPPIGGAIVTYLDWRWIFWINVPMGGLGAWLVGRFIDDFRIEGAATFDRVGFALTAVSLSALLFGLQLAIRPGHVGVAVALLIGGTLGWLLYVAHAKRTPDPILDLSLMSVPTFRLSVLGGTLIRVTQGAQPFLLPLMMQLAFGLTAAASGAVTVATAVGSFAMKSAARPLLRRFGFRWTMMTIGVLSPLAYAITSLFRPGWPTQAMFLVLLVCGFLTSLQFTAYNTIAYADVDAKRMSHATSFYATFQQISLSLGICTASTALSAAMRWRGHSRPGFDDFTVAIWAVTATSLLAILVNRRFAAGAGQELSGHLAAHGASAERRQGGGSSAANARLGWINRTILIRPSAGRTATPAPP